MEDTVALRVNGLSTVFELLDVLIAQEYIPVIFDVFLFLV